MSVAGRDELRYGAWERRSNALARGLLSRGIRPGDRVILVFDAARWTDFAVAWAATAKASAVAVPVGPCFGILEVDRIARHCNAAGVVCAPGLNPLVRAAWVVTSTELEDGYQSGAVQTNRDGEAAEILYGTGPMSSPRPTRSSHRDLFAQAVPWLDSMPGAGPTVLVHLFPVGTPAGQEALRLPLLAPGAVAVAVDTFDPARLCSVVAERRATCVGVTTAHARRIARWKGPSDSDELSSVGCVVLDGTLSQPVRDALAAVFPGSAIATAGRPCDDPGLGHTGPQAQSRETIAPAGLVQEAMLWQEQLAPGCMNLPPLTRRLAGQLDVRALERSLDELARRHQTLRTTFDVVDGQAVQVIGPAGALRLPVEDLSGLSADQKAGVVGAVLSAAVIRPVDLATGPLFQPRLLRLADDEHLLVIPLHHSVWDDWSVGVFNRELSALYPAFVAGSAPSLHEPPVQFADFARRQREELAGSLGAKQLSYWTTQLAGAPLVTQLPLADPALEPGSPQPAAAPISLVLPGTLVGRLRSLARAQNATMFMSMLAAFVVLLRRHTGQDDLLLASVVANRNRTELEGLIGCFAKKVLLRARLAEDPTFPDLVTQVRQVLLEAFMHQDLPYEDVVHEALGRQAARHGLTPYVGVMFQGLTPPGAKLTMPGLEPSRFTLPGTRARRVHFVAGDGQVPPAEPTAPPWGAGLYLGTFLRLTVRETPDAVSCEAWGAFHPPAAERLLDEFHHLLEEVVARPGSRVSELGCTVPARGSATTGAGDMLDLGGFRLDRSRMEAALRQCPGIADVAVCLRAVPAGEPRLVAYVVPATPAPPSLAQLRRFLWTRLPGHAWPSAMVVTASLPRLPGGGLDEAALADPGVAAAGDNASPVREGEDDSTEELRLLAALWEEAAGTKMARDHPYRPDFAFLGLLSSARRLGMSISPRHVTRTRTLEALAAAVAVDPGPVPAAPR